ncbi:hypothetical protein T439DRAFT_331478 [Meredithblackwellia eburnea MCA 4105]
MVLFNFFTIVIFAPLCLGWTSWGTNDKTTKNQGWHMETPSNLTICEEKHLNPANLPHPGDNLRTQIGDFAKGRSDVGSFIRGYIISNPVKLQPSKDWHDDCTTRRLNRGDQEYSRSLTGKDGGLQGQVEMSQLVSS